MKHAFAFAALLAAAPAAAQDEPIEPSGPAEAPLGAASGFDLSGEIVLLSDYRFRGVSRSDEDPALQAALTLSHASGFYAGARGTTLTGLDSFRVRDPGFRDLGDAQLDLYAGYGAPIGGGWEVDAGLLYYVFAGTDGPSDYLEPYASLSYLIGPAYATAGAKYAPSQRAIGGEDMLYLFGQLDVAIPFQPWSLSAQAGRQDWGRFGAHWTWSLGLERQLRFRGLPDAEVAARYVDTDLPDRPGQDAGLILSLAILF